jgi:hypothetical protein
MRRVNDREQVRILMFQILGEIGRKCKFTQETPKTPIENYGRIKAMRETRIFI